MRALLLLSLFFLTACAGSKSSNDAQEPSTDECLSNSAAGDAWGECNVKKTIYQNMDKLVACQEKNPTKGGTMMLKISLKTNGVVKKVRPEAGTVRNRPLEACLSKAFARVKFAAPPEGVKPVIYFPLSL
ncbi:MAG: AgmX/PglI C-terminal domain-containing protein [Bacteriovoracia bacterium]